MLNLPAILNHEEERATNLLNFGLKKRKWRAVAGRVSETIISAVTGLLVTCLYNSRLVSGGPVFFDNSLWMSRKPR